MVPRATHALLPLLVLPLALACGDGGREDVRPNVLVMITDDQSIGTLGCEGHPWSETPALDRLAARGVRFTQACVTSALCSPSRASFLTGRYARGHGVLDNETPFPAGVETFASRLTAAGYDSAYVGKWHMGETPGPRPGFRWSATIAGQGSYRTNDFRIGDDEGYEDRHVQGSVDGTSTAFAVEFLKRPREGPFLLVVGFKAPHRPHRPSLRHEGLYPGREVPEPDNAEAFPPFPLHHELVELAERAGTPVSELVVAEGWAEAFPERHGEEWSGQKVEPAERVRDYFRVIRGVDECVGTLLAALEELGQRERTLVVFTSDNGLGMGSHGLIGKNTCYEEAVRVPWIVDPPGEGAARGVTAAELVLNVDLAPTILDYAGLPPDPAAHGRSLRPLLEQGEGGGGLAPDVPWRTEAVLENSAVASPLPTSVALRSRDWKLVLYPGYGTWTELFDLAADPGERSNLAEDAAHAERLAALRARLVELERALGPRTALERPAARGGG